MMLRLSISFVSKICKWTYCTLECTWNGIKVILTAEEFWYFAFPWFVFCMWIILRSYGS
jgi:hypothetical protein